MFFNNTITQFINSGAPTDGGTRTLYVSSLLAGPKINFASAISEFDKTDPKKFTWGIDLPPLQDKNSNSYFSGTDMLSIVCYSKLYQSILDHNNATSSYINSHIDAWMSTLTQNQKYMVDIAKSVCVQKPSMLSNLQNVTNALVEQFGTNFTKHDWLKKIVGHVEAMTEEVKTSIPLFTDIDYIGVNEVMAVGASLSVIVGAFYGIQRIMRNSERSTLHSLYDKMFYTLFLPLEYMHFLRTNLNLTEMRVKMRKYRDEYRKNRDNIEKIVSNFHTNAHVISCAAIEGAYKQQTDPVSADSLNFRTFNVAPNIAQNHATFLFDYFVKYNKFDVSKYPREVINLEKTTASLARSYKKLLNDDFTTLINLSKFTKRAIRLIRHILTIMESGKPNEIKQCNTYVAILNRYYYHANYISLYEQHVRQETGVLMEELLSLMLDSEIGPKKAP
jgi:hypothetical protein